MIRLEGLTKSYEPRGPVALEGIDLAIPQGSIFGLLGQNGAGKTTLLSILTGLIGKDRGQVHVGGHDLDREPRAIKALTGFVPQELAFYPMLTVRENLAFYGGAMGLKPPRLGERIALGLSITALEDHAHRKAGVLSGGLKRRLNLAIGLLNSPRLLCLDEPTVGVDPASRRFILESVARLREEGMTIVYTSHYMDEVQQVCDRVAIIHRGRILIEGAMNDLLASGGEDKALRVRFESPPSAPLARALEQAFPARVGSEREAVIPCDDPVETLARLTPLLAANRGDRVASIAYGLDSLEDLFLRLTGRDLGD